MSSKVASAVAAPGGSAGFSGWNSALASEGASPLGRGYCTDYAAAVYAKVTGTTLPALGPTAGDWYQGAQKANIPTLPNSASAIAAAPPGSIVVWSGGGDGHVAVVVANNPATQQMTISEANWGRLTANATPFERKNEITTNFDVVDQRKLSYAAVSNMPGASSTFTLEGFILPK
jgi:surface antigen